MASGAAVIMKFISMYDTAPQIAAAMKRESSRTEDSGSRDMPLVVATHSPTIAALFEHHDKVEVILIGGRLYKHSMVSVGAEAIAAIDRIALRVSSLRPDVSPALDKLVARLLAADPALRP